MDPLNKGHHSRPQSPSRRPTLDGGTSSSGRNNIEQFLHDSEEALKLKLQTFIRREHELKIQMDHEEEEKAEVLQKISFAQSELDLIEKESNSLNDQVSATDESLRSLKLRQLDVWEQQQLVDTLSHQKSHKEWLQDEQRQAVRTAEGTAHILEQQALQSILTELMEEKKEIEAKQEECRRDAQKLTWEVQQVQRELLVPQEQVESLQVQLWHQLAGLQTLKEDFHEAEAAQCQAQLNVHVWEDKIADLEELFRLSASDRDQLAKQRGDHQRRLEAGKLRDTQLRAQWQDQENQIRDLAMAKLKLDRDWQRRICQRAEQEQALALVLTDIALEEAFLHEQQTLHAQRLQDAMRQVQHDCAQTYPAEIAQLRQQEQAVLQEMLEAEEQVRNIRSHLVHHDTSIQDAQAQRLHALRRQDIDLAHQIQQQRRRAQTITERDLPLAQLHVQRLSQHEQLLRREEQQELSVEVLRAQSEVAQAEKAISDATQALAIDTGVWKAAQKHAASLQAHTPAMLAEAEAQMKQSRDALQEAQTRLIAAQHRVGTTQDRQSAVTAQRTVVTQELQEAQARMAALTTELSQHEQRIAEDEAQHRQVLQEIDAVERDVSSRIRRMETIQTIGTVDAFPRLLHLQRDVLPQVQQSSLQLQAQWHGQELRGQRFEAAWEGLRSLLDEGDEEIRQLREQAIRLQAALHDPQDPAVRQSVAVQHRLGELSAQINEARQTRDRIVSSIRENAQDAIHAPQNRLLYCTERAKDRQVLEADLQSSRRHLQDEQRRLEDQHATLAGIGIRMKRLQAEVAQLWQEKLQLVPAARSPPAAASVTADGAAVFTDAAHHWPTILLQKQLRLRQLQAQEAQLQRVEKHLWGTRAHVLAVHQRQLQHDLQQVASSALTASSSTAAAVVDMAKSLARASIASLHSSSSDNWALTLRGDASSSLLARSAGEVHLYGGSGTGGAALGLTQHAQYRQQQQWLQQTQRLTQEIASAAQELSRADQRRFILTRDWQEKLRQWLAWSEHEQHLTQDLRHQAEELQQVKQTRLTLQRLVAQRKAAAAQEAAAHPQQHHPHHPHSHGHGHSHSHGHGHSHTGHPTVHQHHHAAPQHRASSPAPGSAAGQYLTPHPNPYPNYLHTASTSRPSTPQRQLASSSGAASERATSPLTTTVSPRASIGGRPSIASAAAVAALIDDRHDSAASAAPAVPSSASKPSRIPMRVGSNSARSLTELAASSAAVGEEDSELQAIALHSAGRHSPSAEWKQSNEERSPSRSKTPVIASNDASAAAAGAAVGGSHHAHHDDGDEDIDVSDVHTFASHELPFSPSHEMHLPFAVTGKLRGGASGTRAISPAAFVAGSKRTPLTPKITSGPKGASPERPLRVSLNRTWSNQSISQKLAKSTRGADHSILTGGGGGGGLASPPPPVVAKPTKKMVAMAAARQQQSQQVDDNRRKNQQLAAASFQF